MQSEAFCVFTHFRHCNVHLTSINSLLSVLSTPFIRSLAHFGIHFNRSWQPNVPFFAFHYFFFLAILSIYALSNSFRFFSFGFCCASPYTHTHTSQHIQLKAILQIIAYALRICWQFFLSPFLLSARCFFCCVGVLLHFIVFVVCIFCALRFIHF